MIIDPKLLTTRQEFKKKTSKLVKRIQRAKRLPGVKEIFVAGERGNKLTQKRLKAGEIEDNLY